MGKKISGTKEWSVESVNCLTGCSHDCRYCYARTNALRFRRIGSAAEWRRPIVRQHELRKVRRKVAGRVMFPTTHDILPEFLSPCIQVLDDLIDAGNQILVVSKPHFNCIQAICRYFSGEGDRILFRFTIGALDDKLLGYWEPGAPTSAERLASLRYAYEHGWQTSISAEPLLDAPAVDRLIETVDPWVTDTIWIGKLNQINARCVPGTDPAAIARIKAGQTPAAIRRIHDAWKDHAKLRWKESYKSALGLTLAEQPGLDI